MAIAEALQHNKTKRESNPRFRRQLKRTRGELMKRHVETIVAPAEALDVSKRLGQVSVAQETDRPALLEAAKSEGVASLVPIMTEKQGLLPYGDGTDRTAVSVINMQVGSLERVGTIVIPAKDPVTMAVLVGKSHIPEGGK